MAIKRNTLFAYLCLSLSLLYLCIVPGQDDFLGILGGVGVASVSYFFLLPTWRRNDSFVAGAIVLISLRVVLLFIFPNLSDDIFRFFWDGTCWHHGIHPFANTPENLLNNGQGNSCFDQLYPLLNSPSYYSIYPLVCQLIYAAASLIGCEVAWVEVFSLKLILLVFDIGTFFLIVKILGHLAKPQSIAFIYFLNPLFITEAANNVHFENVMVFFLALMIYAFLTKKWTIAGVSYALAIATKLVPLLFGPMLLFYTIRKKRWAQFWGAASIAMILLFVPLFKDHYLNMLASVDLYFQSFEFNASIYFMARDIWGYFIGYNPIASLGPILGIISFLLIVSVSILAFFRARTLKDYFPYLLAAFYIYLFLATTVHPWYLIVPLFFSVLVQCNSVLLWTCLVFLSYSAYDTNPVQQHYWAMYLQYLPVVVLLYFDIRSYKLRSKKLPNEITI